MQLPSLDQLHHAYIITGNRQKSLEFIKTYLTENKIAVAGNPDVYFFDQEIIKIDELREQIIPLLSVQKLGSKRFVIVSIDQIGVETQNAFLKNLEEPQEGTYIFILIPSEKKLLPTIISRVQLVHGAEHEGVTRLDTKEFIKKNLAGRFEYIETWTKSKKDEENVSKSEVLYFIDNLEKYLWENNVRSDELFADIRKMHEYAAIRGASHRVILDFLAMVVPQKM